MPPDVRTQSGPHVFVSSLDAPELSDDDRHHLAKSLRVRDGDPFTATDGAGNWRTMVFGTTIEPTGDVHHVAAPAYGLGLGIALTKAAKPEFAVQKATEIGIDTIIVFPAEHSVVRWDATKRGRNEQRLLRVAREAAMQSRRVRLPTVRVASSLQDITQEHAVTRADFVGTATIAHPRFILIGPEGGWSAQERSDVPDAVDLGATVLRAETAAVVAAAFMARSRERSD